MARLLVLVSNDKKKTEHGLFISKVSQFKSECKRKEFHPLWLRVEDVQILLAGEGNEVRNKGIEALTAGQLLMADIEAPDHIVNRLRESLGAVNGIYVSPPKPEDMVRWIRTLDPIIAS